MYVRTENEGPTFSSSKVTHTHAHTDSTEIITYPHTRMVLTGASCNSSSFISYLHKLESNSATWVLLYQESSITYC